MKRLVIAILSTLLFSVTQTSDLNAQNLAANPCSSPIVNTACVGACGTSAEMIYTSVIHDYSQAKIREHFCIKTESSSLCPTDRSKTTIYINGKIVDTYDSTASGTTYTFSARKGSHISVKTELTDGKSQVNCVWLGEVHLSLRRAL